MTLYAHPFSSYSQKVLIALWENETPFTHRHLEDPGAAEERAALWALGQFPVLADAGRTIAESSIIIEHLDLRHRGPVRLLPDDRGAEFPGLQDYRARLLARPSFARAVNEGRPHRTYFPLGAPDRD